VLLISKTQCNNPKSWLGSQSVYVVGVALNADYYKDYFIYKFKGLNTEGNIIN